MPFADITGQKFGRLTAIKRNSVDRKGNVLWLCRCECGGTSIVRGTHLRKGEIKTCGGKGRSCRRVERADITGQQFGTLTVIRRDGVKWYGQKVQQWLCKCVCGKKIRISSSALRQRQSCGCIARAAARIRSTKHGLCGSSQYALFHGAKRRAKQAGYASDLELSDIAIPALCPLLGIQLQRSKHSISSNSPTLDKLDPNGRYVKGNVWVISQKANRLKSNMTLAQMKHFVRVIEQRMKTK